MDRQEQLARALEDIASDFEVAAAHCRTAAVHVTNSEIPRFAAHCWAATGHIDRGNRALSQLSGDFADRSTPDITEQE